MTFMANTNVSWATAAVTFITYSADRSYVSPDPVDGNSITAIEVPFMYNVTLDAEVAAYRKETTYDVIPTSPFIIW